MRRRVLLSPPETKNFITYTPYNINFIESEYYQSNSEHIKNVIQNDNVTISFKPSASSLYKLLFNESTVEEIIINCPDIKFENLELAFVQQYPDIMYRNIYVDNLDLSEVVNMNYTFSGQVYYNGDSVFPSIATNLYSYDFIMPKVQTLEYTFAGVIFRNDVNISCSNLCTSTQGMFLNAQAPNQFSIENLDTSNVSDMSYMFAWCDDSILSKITWDTFNMSNATHVFGMFKYCNTHRLSDYLSTSLQLSTNSLCDELFCGIKDQGFILFNTIKAASCNYMFANAECTDIYFSRIYTDYLVGMFMNATGLEHVSIENIEFNGDSVESLFNNCQLLHSVDFSQGRWNFENCWNFSEMFANCHSLESIKFVGDANNYRLNYTDMFVNCGSLYLIEIPNETWDFVIDAIDKAHLSHVTVQLYNT